MSDTFMNVRGAIRELEDALERSRADLTAAIGAITNVDADDIYYKSDNGVTLIDWKVLRELLNDVVEAEENIADALRDHDWEVARALRVFKQALTHEAASC
jgi:hypothetical protein